MTTFRKYFLLTSITLIVIIFVLLALFFLNQDFQELIISLTVEEETVYAKGYSLKSFKQVRINDSADKVIHLLGEPLAKDKVRDDHVVFYYSEQGPKDTNYRERKIVFNREGKVKKIIREFYID